MSTAKTAPAAPAPQAPETEQRTPENTPLPGGGRWVWDTEQANWAPAPTQE